MKPEETAAVITGGAGGLGLSLAAALGGAGYQVALLDRDVRGVEGYAAFEADVTDRPSVERAVAQVAETVAPPLVLVNAAGIAESSGLLPPDDDLWSRTQAVNVTGTWIASTACLAPMKEAGAGFICNVASTAALEGFKYTAAYVASKHAVLGLTRAMAMDLDGKGVRVCAICPGFLDTAMTERTVANMTAKTGMPAEDARTAIAKMNRSGRLIQPDEVAEAILHLVASDYSNGEVVRLD